MAENQVGNDVNQIEIVSLSKIRGQKKVTDLLKVNLDAYFQSRQNGNPGSFGPVLLCGHSGTGKTLVAKALHAELANLDLIETNGEMLSSSGELTSILLSATENTTVFIDECQGMHPRSQHILLTALSERVIYVPRRANNKSKQAIPLENFTLIMATTHEYFLQAALRNRMRIYARFEYYSLEDLVEIIRQRALALNWNIESGQVLTEIAKRSKKTPRIALNRNLQQCWNVAAAKGKESIGMDDVLEAFRLIQIDQLGLDELERNYLRILHQNGPTALNVISSKLALPTQTVKSVLEPYLLQENLIGKNKCSHREITFLGQEHIQNCQM
ncbi:Holliday junction ATP-dependent DNA helicase RuvB [Anaerohalosphaera lusitana]|uniref:Holliday junction ATP-dependent DNA helicase RuvB n=1 Tax=Anaerohalosphaera lusitana TaxID=1936003 RepID=A0A1U9NR03_9BACT|nr:Holliday junction DNA helicase RuvB C-terminal domain-containing protein [Anaerohalosphaera lusitana]AQT70050.1 Holliday junction ATP-dependent DNA helicase RuvB [Anaerohalosphaera lusitana]